MSNNYSVVTRERKDGTKYAVINKDGKIVCYVEDELNNAERISKALNMLEDIENKQKIENSVDKYEIEVEPKDGMSYSFTLKVDKKLSKAEIWRAIKIRVKKDGNKVKDILGWAKILVDKPQNWG